MYVYAGVERGGILFREVQKDLFGKGAFEKMAVKKRALCKNMESFKKKEKKIQSLQGRNEFGESNNI